MIIPCSEKCLYQEEGLCTLTQVTSSGTPIDGCPHYLEKGEKKEGTKRSVHLGIEEKLK
ncbi:hypothetical protein [Clostridium sp. Cult1]|uniref:hypothetical protein n=1 Tax=Clostridium sp. Cult1 TaxID=2079002 RepID=UPI001F21A303|nr:hypothetical protein [Clostridium sp. Cult1]